MAGPSVAPAQGRGTRFSGVQPYEATADTNDVTTSISRPAKVRFLTSDEGGRLTNPRSGYRPQVALGQAGLSTTCVVESVEGSEEEFGLGVEAYVKVTLLFPLEYGDQFARLTSLSLFEGSKLVARGSFTKADVDGEWGSR